MRFNLILLILLCFWYSCQREKIVLEDYGTDKGIGVSAFITESDLMFNVYLSNSRKTIGGIASEEEPLTNALVTIYSTSDSLVIPYDGNTSSYLGIPSPGFFKQGVNYRLNIEVPGKGVYSSETQITNYYVAPIIEGSVKQRTVSSDKYYDLELSWEDQTGYKNYYRLVPLVVMLNDSEITDTLVAPIDGSTILVYDDKEAIDGIIKVKTSILSNTFDFPPYRVIGVKYYLMNVDANYYKFHNDLKKINYFDQLNNPVILQGNIKNGYGIFASYNGASEKTFLLP
jgi:hypothetical protein